MDQKKITLTAAAIIAIAATAGAGFFFYKNNASQTADQAGQNSEKGALVEQPIIPLRLDYTINNFGPGGSNGSSTLSYYVESKKTCGDREAYLGLMKVENGNDPSRSQYAKFSIFADNGQMAVSQWNNETSMAFDDAAAFYNEMDLPTVVSDIFSYSSKNFNSSEYWEAKEPIILKDVSTGRSIGNYSIIPLEEDNSKLVPCKKFKIIAKTSNMDGYFTACIAKEISGVSVPLVVSFAFENEQGPSWELKSFSNEKSGIAWVPQCLAPVSCEYVAEPSQNERTACNAKDGQYESVPDEKGCVKEYACKTYLEMANETISRFQNPNCQIDQTVLDKYLQCRKDNKPNFDPANYDDQGCLTDIDCR
ncbi:MAG: hypothetical protein WC926_00680 [Candidatus Paceibacterota bacterium]|jgi:hypothetical protein